MGNESNGIRNEILKLVDKKICIDKKNGKAESLNVSICASIFLYKIFSFFFYLNLDSHFKPCQLQLSH